MNTATSTTKLAAAQSTIKMTTIASPTSKSNEQTPNHRMTQNESNDQHGRPMLQLLPTEIRQMIIRNLFTISLRQIPKDILETLDLTCFTSTIDKKHRNMTEYHVYSLAMNSDIHVGISSTS